jgi:hypothetical protein
VHQEQMKAEQGNRMKPVFAFLGELGVLGG